MSTYAIGDVQGCFDALQQLLVALDFDRRRDRLWFAGDLVNRGPQSLETLRFVRSLGDRAATVLGNHDLHLLAVAEGRKPGRRDTLAALLAAPDRDELLDWLRRQPLMHTDARLGYTMLHAGLPPQWSLAQARACAGEAEAVLRGSDYRHFLHKMYGDEPDQWSDALDGTARIRFIVNCFTRLRYCDAEGRLAPEPKGTPGSQNPSLLPWFAVPGRRSAGTQILFGHWSTLGRIDWPEYAVHGLDTGCVWGGRLSALCLETGETTSIDCDQYRSPDGGD
jgi:bis(5'-nucleosyl)-tetraphosphatase (symmetrical)